MAKKSKKKKKPAVAGQGFGSQSLSTELAHARALIRRDQWLEAHRVALSLRDQHPDSLEVLDLLMDTSYGLEQFHLYQATCEAFLTLKPNDSQANFMLGHVYLLNYYPLLAMQQYRRAMERWPDHPDVIEGKEHIAKIEPNLGEVLESLGFTYPEDMELAQLDERLRAYLETHCYEAAIATAQQLVEQYPDVVSSYNGLAMAYAANNRYEDAIATIVSSLDKHPENVALRTNLIRFLCFRGRFDEAQQHRDALIEAPGVEPDDLTRKAEALAYLGDNEAIISLIDQVPPDPRDKENRPLATGMFHHLAAVALARQGEPVAARHQWQLALEIHSHMTIARENLDDFDSTDQHRQGAWAFELNNWLEDGPYQALRQVAVAMTPEREPEPQLVAAVEQLLSTYPFIDRLLPVWLERGSPRSRMLAIVITKAQPNEAHLAMLNEFATSTHGSDAQRYHIASYLAQRDQLTSQKLWLNGEWQEEPPLVTYKIVEDTDGVTSPEAKDLQEKAMKKIALESVKAAETAEALLKQALEIEPDNPVLLNNLAVAYNTQERQADARQLTQEIIDGHPEDVDSRIAIAQIYLEEGNTDAAEAVIDQLLTRQEFTADALVSLLLSRSRLLMMQEKKDQARLWFQEVLPLVKDHPLLRELGIGR